MAKSNLRSRDRQRIRREVNAAVAGLPVRFVLEAVAPALGLTTGRLELHFRDGFLVRWESTHPLELAAGEMPVDWSALTGTGSRVGEEAPAANEDREADPERPVSG
ncbi:MAG: hypothetical protein QOG85_203 [Gaiellaceae bacterium]|jgi:hypothetical protein|nr:hypothetical protein [Gaiellaceae bacterium]